MPINYKEYPSNWKTEIKPAVKLRSGDKCEFCGAPNHTWIYRHFKGKKDWRIAPEGMEMEAMSLDGTKFIYIVLTTAHLDHDKLNHGVSVDRLRDLCQRCHLKHDMDHHVANRKYGNRKNNYKLEL
jgi:hypothetical protein